MLILPLHRPLNASTFPFATAILILLNAFVFFALQGSDGAAMRKAQEQYARDDLARFELPAYEQHLKQAGQDELLVELQSLPESRRGEFVAQRTLTDVTFIERLRRGELFESAAAFEAWKPLRHRYDQMQGDVFTLRHLMRSSEIDPWRMFAATFLHGDAMHLIGNMIFLAALGLLVEGALGPLRFTCLYVLGAMGSSAVSLAWRWGEAGGGLGASGAIAALMGAFCVIWGRHPVRFFYWVGVVFDYVRAPAIWLLPAWLGWEIYNLFAHPDLGIGFDAHAGGLICGALLGAVLVATHQVRTDFIVEPERIAERDQRWEQAQTHLGRMQLAEADALLRQLQQEAPQRFEVALARYRVAMNGTDRRAQRERLLDLLQRPASDVAEVRFQVEAQARHAQIALDGTQRAALARRWLQLGEIEACEALLRATTEAEGAGVELAQAWLDLGLRWRERNESEAARRVLEHVVARFPQQPQARKARFLLENG